MFQKICISKTFVEFQVWDDHLARQAQDIANTCTFHRTEVSDSRS